MCITIEHCGRVAVLTMNRPEALNAVNAQLTQALSDAYRELDARDDTWVVVLTGAGDRSFSAGADLKEVSTNLPGRSTGEGDTGESRVLAPPEGGFGGIVHRGFGKPIIAAVNGYALGGGFEMTLACDLVVAEEHATFGLPEVKRGIVAAAGGIVRLAQRIPRSLALEIAMTGRPLTAQRAHELGLVNRVVPKGRGVDEAVVLAEEICSNAPLAVRVSRKVIRASVGMEEPRLFEMQAELTRGLLASEDTREGVRAFMERRAPQWRAR